MKKRARILVSSLHLRSTRRHVLSRRPPPPLLNMPYEMVLSITNELSSCPEAIVALALTCRSLFRILERVVATLRGDHRSRANLLVLLEKDLGSKFFYCSAFCQLHRFKPSWNPTNTEHIKAGNCHLGQFFNPNPENSPYRLYHVAPYRLYHVPPYRLYHVHARLVMNRHLHGAPNGLPLETLAKRASARSSPCDYTPKWTQRPTAKIIGDELFLSIVHTVQGTAGSLRKALEAGSHRTCMHVTTAGVAGMYRIPELVDVRPYPYGPWPDMSFGACRDVLRSCTMCLTDYTTTVERAAVPPDLPSYPEPM